MEKGHFYLQFQQGESSAGADTAVILDGGTSDDGAEFVDGAGGDGGGFGEAGLSASLFAAGLEGGSVSLGGRGKCVGWGLPGRNGLGRDAASLCGNLEERIHQHGVLRGRGWFVVWLTIVWDLPIVLDGLEGGQRVVACEEVSVLTMVTSGDQSSDIGLIRLESGMS